MVYALEVPVHGCFQRFLQKGSGAKAGLGLGVQGLGRAGRVESCVQDHLSGALG